MEPIKTIQHSTFQTVGYDWLVGHEASPVAQHQLFWKI